LEKGNARKVFKRISRAYVNSDQQFIDYAYDNLQIIYTIKLGDVYSRRSGVISSVDIVAFCFSLGSINMRMSSSCQTQHTGCKEHVISTNMV